MQHKIPPFTKHPYKSASKDRCRVCGKALIRPLPAEQERENGFGSVFHFETHRFNVAVCSYYCETQLLNSDEDLIDKLYQFIDDIQYESEELTKKLSKQD